MQTLVSETLYSPSFAEEWCLTSHSSSVPLLIPVLSSIRFNESHSLFGTLFEFCFQHDIHSNTSSWRAFYLYYLSHRDHSYYIVLKRPFL